MTESLFCKIGIHKWKTLFQSNAIDSHYFIHRRCERCHINDLENSMPYFGCISQAIDLGMRRGIYKAVFESGNLNIKWLGNE